MNFVLKRKKRHPIKENTYTYPILFYVILKSYFVFGVNFKGK